VNSRPTVLPEALRQRFAERLGRRFSCGESTRLQHVRDESIHEPLLPDGVVMAESTDEVAFIVRRCSEQGVPLIPYGIGLGKRKYLVPEHGAVAVDVMRMLKTALDPHNLLNPGKILPER
jgi:D-lactate dehydrogenase (cytochrome)